MFFFSNHTATTEIYTLSLHDALPISKTCIPFARSNPPSMIVRSRSRPRIVRYGVVTVTDTTRSEEHTSELQSLTNLVCRLLLEKKKKKKKKKHIHKKTKQRQQHKKHK